jgi:hypothetical protein
MLCQAWKNVENPPANKPYWRTNIYSDSWRPDGWIIIIYDINIGLRPDFRRTLRYIFCLTNKVDLFSENPYYHIFLDMAALQILLDITALFKFKFLWCIPSVGHLTQFLSQFPKLNTVTVKCENHKEYIQTKKTVSLEYAKISGRADQWDNNLYLWSLKV